MRQGDACRWPAWLLGGIGLAATLVSARGAAQIATPMAAALGQAAVASDGYWGLAENPATAPSSTPGFAVQAYGRSHGNLPELATFALDLGYALRGGYITLGAQHFDPPGYSATAVLVGAGRQLADGLTAGVRIGVVSADYEAFGTELLPVAEGGIRYRVTGALSAGAHYRYVERPTLPLAEHRLRVGVRYRSSPKVSVLVAGWQPVGATLAGGLGVVYQPADRVVIRAGIQSEGLAIGFGVDVEALAGVRLALTAQAYQQLPGAYTYGAFWRQPD